MPRNQYCALCISILVYDFSFFTGSLLLLLLAQAGSRQLRETGPREDRIREMRVPIRYVCFLSQDKGDHNERKRMEK